MIRIFNRYLSIRHAIYFIFENILIAFFVMWGMAFRGDVANMILVPLVCQICLHYCELNPPFPRFSLKEFWVKHLQAILWAALILFVIYFIIPLPFVSASWPGARLAFLPFILIGLRLAYQRFVTARRWAIPILIMGSGSIAELLKKTLTEGRAFGHQVFHLHWDLASPAGAAEEWENLREIVAQHKIKKVVVALLDRRKQLPVESLLSLRVQGIEVVEAVSLYEKISGKIFVRSLKPSDLIFCDGFNRVKLVHVSKRILDILLAFIGLILSLPIFLILSVLIKLDSKGPVFYRQERVGERGRPFMLMKFRSMRQDAEAVSGPVWASEGDSRVTRVGRVMRLLRVDEIPQMINVLKGEMSFVGPRPERPVFVEQLQKKIPYYDLRFTVKPGLTGWAQVKYQYGSSEEDALEKLQYDLYYIKHLSLLFDLTIVFETIQVVLMGKGSR